MAELRTADVIFMRKAKEFGPFGRHEGRHYEHLNES
jgi:hypothetical protein